MSYPCSQYPDRVWDGTTPNLERVYGRVQRLDPNPDDWDQIVSEVIATQTKLGEGAGAIDDHSTLSSLTWAAAGHTIGAEGIDYTPGSDIDVDIATIDVTGTPRFWWNETADSFEMNKTLVLPGGSLVIGACSISEIGSCVTTPSDIAITNLSVDKSFRIADSDGNLDAVLSRQVTTNDVSVGDIDANGGKVHIYADGSEAITVLENGYVGIGLVPTEGKLHVKQTGDTYDGGITVEGTGGGTGRFYHTDSDTVVLQRGENANQVVLESAGDVSFAGQIKVAGGAPGSGKILCSNADGLASWDAVINNQVASNYFDIGALRMQWGDITYTADDPTAMTLPAPFANTNYTVLLSLDAWEYNADKGPANVSNGISVTAKSTTTFTVNRDNDLANDTVFAWFAIGLKP